LWSCWGYVGSYKLEPIRFALGCGAVEAWEAAARYCGIPAPNDKPETPAERRERERRNRARIEAERRRRAEAEARERPAQLAEARACWAAREPIGGTLGDRDYLETARGIPAPLAG
jgi:hypothetical protein